MLHAVAALASVTQPRLFRRQDMQVDVEVAGQLTRGMTVFDRRREMGAPANIEVCVDVDEQGVVDYLSKVLAGG
ncbi:MAG: hypothetical protein CM1200mP2_23280 [Planctomycetaceae bacterium]|nr:MAG: hypothetical protein CM1200mP2_23280 [Planctomycetaceae bacterium]